jgi:hypothetical protein
LQTQNEYFCLQKLRQNYTIILERASIGTFPYVVFLPLGTILAPRHLARFLLLATSMPENCLVVKILRGLNCDCSVQFVTIAFCQQNKNEYFSTYAALLRQWKTFSSAKPWALRQWLFKCKNSHVWSAPLYQWLFEIVK